MRDLPQKSLPVARIIAPPYQRAEMRLAHWRNSARRYGLSRTVLGLRLLPMRWVLSAKRREGGTRPSLAGDVRSQPAKRRKVRGLGRIRRRVWNPWRSVIQTTRAEGSVTVSVRAPSHRPICNPMDPVVPGCRRHTELAGGTAPHGLFSRARPGWFLARRVAR